MLHRDGVYQLNTTKRQLLLSYVMKTLLPIRPVPTGCRFRFFRRAISARPADRLAVSVIRRRAGRTSRCAALPTGARRTAFVRIRRASVKTSTGTSSRAANSTLSTSTTLAPCAHASMAGPKTARALNAPNRPFAPVRARSKAVAANLNAHPTFMAIVCFLSNIIQNIFETLFVVKNSY